MKKEILGKVNMKGLCTKCGRETKFETKSKEEVIKVRREPIKVEMQYCRCMECGDEIFDPNINKDPLDLAYRDYRMKHGLLQPEEIRDWRKAHELTQGELAKLLGLGAVTISRYENGALQDESHERLLRFIMEPSNLLKAVEKSEDVFSEAKKKRLLDTLRGEEADTSDAKDKIIISFGNYPLDEYSGKKKFDLAKLYCMILYFCKGGTFETKLNKLLFYADFKHYRECGISISGAQYAHIPFGPAPDQYRLFYQTLLLKGAVDFIGWASTLRNSSEPIEGIKIQSKIEPNLNMFSTSELRTLVSVKEHFGDWTAGKITRFSHEEVGYKKTSDGKLISYEFAKQLKF